MKLWDFLIYSESIHPYIHLTEQKEIWIIDNIHSPLLQTVDTPVKL